MDQEKCREETQRGAIHTLQRVQEQLAHFTQDEMVDQTTNFNPVPAEGDTGGASGATAISANVFGCKSPV